MNIKNDNRSNNVKNCRTLDHNIHNFPEKSFFFSQAVPFIFE